VPVECRASTRHWNSRKSCDTNVGVSVISALDGTTLQFVDASQLCPSVRSSIEVDSDDVMVNGDGAGKLTNALLCGAEYHSRGHKLCSHSVVSQHFMEPEGS
jgi:hypothetical protein